MNLVAARGFGVAGATGPPRPAILLVCAAALLLAGCAHDQHFTAMPEVVTGAGLMEEYVLRPYDVLEVKFFHNPELNEVVTVRPDGVISLQMIDEVQAAGLTPSQLDALLTRKYSLLLDTTMITVFVRSFSDQKVYVGGEVLVPGAIALRERMNALEAVFMAGGFKPDAQTSQVVIISRNPDRKPVARRVNLDRALTGRLAFEEYRLRPYDIVFVPRTCLATADRFMTHIYNLLPRQVFLAFSYEIHNEPVEVEDP